MVVTHPLPSPQKVLCKGCGTSTRPPRGEQGKMIYFFARPVGNSNQDLLCILRLDVSVEGGWGQNLERKERRHVALSAR